MTTSDGLGGLPCRICDQHTAAVGNVHGSYSRRDYQLRRCDSCGFAFIADPWTDFERIYDVDYYHGRGADPMVDYVFELSHPGATIRAYEWRGITSVVKQLLGRIDDIRWLDFGAGNGGLVRYAEQHTAANILGFEQGAIAADARRLGVPLIEELEELSEGSFDVVTAIEVLEHTVDPLFELRRMRRVLRPGGLLLLTTGNAGPFASRLCEWKYVIPEIHVSFFEPGTLIQAFSRTGFRAGCMPSRGGFDDILKFKVLKNLGVRRRTRFTDLLPATPIALVANARTKLRAHPLGWAE